MDLEPVLLLMVNDDVQLHGLSRIPMFKQLGPSIFADRIVCSGIQNEAVLRGQIFLFSRIYP